MTDSDYERAADDLIKQIRLMQKLMESDRVDIERTKAESEALKVETRSILVKLGASI
jgi:hypothetical protein